MIIYKKGMRYTYSGTTYTIGAAVVATEESEYGYFVLNWMALSHKHRFLSCESQHLESEVWCAGQ